MFLLLLFDPKAVKKNVKKNLGSMNDPAASSGVSSSLLCRHSVLLTESSRVFWIPAFAGMTNSPQAAGNTTLREFNLQTHTPFLAIRD
jgi:hypothetical protein